MNQRILIVDDETSILSALKRLFRNQSYVIFTASSGEKALELLEAQTVDLIISDMRMPGLSGADFLEQAKTLYPLTERILLTGYSDMESTVKAINDGGIFGYLSKPWDAAEVISLVDNALAHRRKNKLKNRVLKSFKKQNDALTIDIERSEREMAQSAAFVDHAVKTLETKQSHQKEEIALSEQNVDQAYQDLHDGYSVMEEVLINLIDLKLKGQRDVGQRISEVVSHIATDLCLSDEIKQTLIISARLHGIGKMGIPDEILKLTLDEMSPEQFLLYKQYPANGACTLMAFSPLQEVSSLLFQQKEYLDGSGYPNGLCGDELPLTARILVLAIDYVEWRLGIKITKHLCHDATMSAMQAEKGKYDQSLLTSLSSITMEIEQASGDTEIVLPLHSLKEGMILQKNISTVSGILLLRKGAVLSEESIEHLLNMQENMSETILVSVRFNLDL